MKNVKTLLFCLLTFQLIFAGVAFTKKKQRIAVLDFSESANKVSGLGKVAANTINDHLVGMGRLDVIDRANLAGVLKEQELQQSGIIDTGTAVNLGRTLGVDFIVAGEASQSSVSRNLKTLEKKDYKTGVVTRKKVWRYSATSSVQIRIINIENSKIEYSGTKAGSLVKDEDIRYELREEKTEAFGGLIKETKQKKVLVEPKGDPSETHSSLVVNALKKACAQFEVHLYNTFRVTGYIIKIDAEKRIVTLDIGEEDGIKKLDRLELIEKEPDTKHPVTGEILPGIEKSVGGIVIREVQANYSYAKVSKKELKKIKVGTIVKQKKKSATGLGFQKMFTR